MIRGLFVIVGVLWLVTPVLADPYSEAIEKLEAAAKSDAFEQSVWFEIKNAFGEWEKTILVFGYWDDFSACAELVSMFSSRYPLRETRCNPLK